ncbi:hypothetical protein LEP48_11500 [Isoptericola sp. NEAU-Y5]|uniref:PRC-barrel domain-containing protein n=1 Tax=Isoptericola luteus TaxID=2879484 RepID=A0ABS7ZG18_9MICO|nr:hypothetical protein [Isoptericola sp. NEAU-Y5]MCA5893969.1 hypothetical protein [Isoptericola sp. NEAU-Y5]
MNVGDLLDARVLGPDGVPLGVVVDVRLALETRDEPDDGPGGREDREDREDSEDRKDSEHDAALSSRARRDAVGGAVVLGLLVGPRRAGSYHGYERTQVRSPWPVPQIVRRLHRGTYLVRWQDVAAVDDGAAAGAGGWSVRLAPGYAELPPELG